MKNYYNLGMVVGANTSQWGVEDYHKRAKQIFDSLAPANFLMVQLAQNGGLAHHQIFTDKESMATAYDLATNSPGSWQYVASFDRSDPAVNAATLDYPGMLDSAYFTAVTTNTTTRSQTGLAWILGGLGLGTLLVASTRKGR